MTERPQGTECSHTQRIDRPGQGKVCRQCENRYRAVSRVVTGACLALMLSAAPSAGRGADPSETGQPPALPGNETGHDPVPANHPGLTPEQKQSLKDAARRGDSIAVESLVIAAIARAPGTASLIVRDAVRVIPDHAALIVDAVQSAFPNLRERADNAAQQGLKMAVSEAAIRLVDLEAQHAREEDAGDQWSGKLSLGGSHRSGTARTLSANFGGEVVHESDKWRNSLDFSFDYDNRDGDTNTHRIRTRARTEHALSGRLYVFGLLNYKNDRTSGFDFQLTESAGAGYRVVDTGRFSWDLEAGPSWRQSRVTETEEMAREIFFRGGSKLKWTVSDTAEITNETSFLYNGDTVEVESGLGAGFQESDEVTNVTALDMRVIGNLAARVSAELSYTSNPPPGGTKTETLSKFALVHNF